MSNLTEAFKIPINCENQEFVTHPYIPIQSIGQYQRKVDPSVMTMGRCFDIKYGCLPIIDKV